MYKTHAYAIATRPCTGDAFCFVYGKLERHFEHEMMSMRMRLSEHFRKDYIDDESNKFSTQKKR